MEANYVGLVYDKPYHTEGYIRLQKVILAMLALFLIK